SLTKDSTIDLMGNMKFRTADSEELRFYPLVEYEIVGEGVPITGAPGATGVATIAKVNVTTNVTTAAPTVPPTAPTTTATAAPTATPKTEPGFESVFAIAGLLAVAFLVLRQRK
ncbi:MAG: PGF-CTERM sorting domain-containing protein, partial [Candidatus Methanoperedens sp.]|nr:PGF-CTERM sorting domain-containing protein [Candidatus Methanoperedens sp.]